MNPNNSLNVRLTICSVWKYHQYTYCERPGLCTGGEAVLCMHLSSSLCIPCFYRKGTGIQEMNLWNNKIKIWMKKKSLLLKFCKLIK